MSNALTELSDQELTKSILRLRKQEVATSLLILRYLAEVESRKLYLENGFSSMFAFCTKFLHYSESCATRRIRSARCIQKYEAVAAALEAREVNLSTISLIAGVLNGKNCEELLRKISHKSQREVEAIVAEYTCREALNSAAAPAVRTKERIKPVAVPAPQKSPLSNEKGLFSSIPSKKGCSGRNNSALEVSSEIETRYELKFSISEDLKKQLQTAQSFLSNKYPKGPTLEDTFSELLSAFIKKKSPKERAGRRKEKRNTNSTKTRHIPAATRDAVLLRDGGRCSFRAPDGTRCNSTWHLAIDHIQPYSMGGSNDASNLRLLCASHNRLQAERSFGKEYIESFINS